MLQPWHDAHWEKNICDNIIGPLLNQERKSKDNYKVEKEHVDLGIRSVLHPKQRLNNTTVILPMASY